jgi:hypothetical protein
LKKLFIPEKNILELQNFLKNCPNDCSYQKKTFNKTCWARMAPKMPGIFVMFRHLGSTMFLGE